MTGGLPSFDPNVLFGATSRSAADDLVKSYLKNAEKEITKKQQAMVVPYENEMTGYQREVQKWIPVSDSISEAQTRITSATLKIKALEKTLKKMIGQVSTLAADTDWSKVARQFDTLRTTLNSSAHSGGSDNLIGSVRRGDTYAGNKITAQIDPNGTDITINGSYTGTDYDIKLSDGTFFRPTGAQTMQRFKAYPAGTVGHPESVASGSVSADRLQDPSLDFTVGKSTHDPTQFTNATLQRHGLGVLQSWLYDGLSTAAGRQRAVDDLKEAKDKIKILKINLEMQKSVLENYASRAIERRTEAQNKIAEVQQTAQVELQRYVKTAQQEARANANAVAAGMNSPAVQLLRTNSRIGTIFDLTT